MKVNPWVVAVFSVSFIFGNPDHYRTQTVLALCVAAAYVGRLIWTKTHFTLGLLFAWSLLRAFSVYAVPKSLYGGLASESANETCRRLKMFSDQWYVCTRHAYDDTLTAFKFVSAEATVPLILISVTAASMTRKGIDLAIEAFSWLCIVSGVVMLFHHSCSVLNNAAMDASFLVTLLPLVTLRKGFRYRSLAIVPITAIVHSGSSTAFLASFVLIAAWAVAKDWRRSAYMIMPVLLLWTVLSQLVPLRHGLFDSYGRTAIWGDAWTMFMKSDHKLSGFGTGTYFLWGPLMRGDQLFIWLHNEFLQIGFEQGIVGLALALSILVVALWRTRKSEWMFPIIATTGFTMMSQMPLRHCVSAFYLAVILRRVWAPGGATRTRVCTFRGSDRLESSHERPC